MTEYPPPPTSIPPWLKLERNPDYHPPVDLTPRVNISKTRNRDGFIIEVTAPDYFDRAVVRPWSFLLGLRLRLAKRKLLKRYWLTRKLSD